MNGAACTALATIAPQWGITALEVRLLCQDGTQQSRSDLEAVQIMTIVLIRSMVSRGADPSSLARAAKDAYHGHRKLGLDEVTVADLF